MEERIFRLEQENTSLKRSITVLEKKVRELETHIRKLARMPQRTGSRIRK